MKERKTETSGEEEKNGSPRETKLADSSLHLRFIICSERVAARFFAFPQFRLIRFLPRRVSLLFRREQWRIERRKGRTDALNDPCKLDPPSRVPEKPRP